MGERERGIVRVSEGREGKEVHGANVGGCYGEGERKGGGRGS